MYDSVRGETGAVIAAVGAVGAWLTYRATPLTEARVTKWTVFALAVFFVGMVLWLPVCIEQETG